ncbi:MAG: cell division protein FtsZ [Ruminococcaceae bacterium]|nr:cell division protein FtsZ [Oscillospiraceae bacterium]
MAFTIDDNNDGFEVADDFQMTTKIMVFGVGGAGGNAVSHMVESGIHDVEYVIANTDVAALRGKDGSKMKRIQIGRKTTKGQGAGNDPSKGRDSAEENREDIEKAMEGVSMLFIAAGMGGGTGTGAAPVVASVAKDKDILTVGVVTKPFGWEGTSKMRQAIGGISEMKKYVDALIVIPNDRLKELKGAKITLKNAFSEVDNILCKAVMGIIKLLQGDGHINVDFADVKMALSNSGIAHMAIGHGKGDYKIDEALDEVLNSPLLETSINGARRGLLNISVPSTLSFEEFDSLTQDIAEKFNTDARYKFGVVFDDSLAEDEISLIVVATDFEEDAPMTSVPGVSVSSDPEPMASVTVTPTSEGLSGNVGFASGASDIDLLLQKFNQGRD